MIFTQRQPCPKIEMLTYPENGTCSQSNPSATICGPDGRCLPDRALCTCSLYMNPLLDCQATIFDSIVEGAISFAVVCSLVTLAIGGAFVYEFVKDCQYLRKPFRSPVFYTKGGILVYCIIKLVRVGLWIAGLVERTTKYALAESIFQALAISIFGAAYMLSSSSFFALLLKAKKFDGAKPKELRIIKFFIIGMILTVIPAIIAMMILEIYEVGTPLIGTVSTVFLMTMLGTDFILMFVYIIRIFLWFRREKELFASSTRLMSLRRKTIIVTSLTVWLILTSLIIPMTGEWGEDLPDVILARAWITFFNEASGIMFMWFFLENQLTKRIMHLSSSGSSSKSSTKETGMTGSGLSSSS